LLWRNGLPGNEEKLGFNYHISLKTYILFTSFFFTLQIETLTFFDFFLIILNVIPDDWLNLNAKFNTPFCSKYCPLSKRRRRFFQILQPLPVTSPSCVNIYTLAAKGLKDLKYEICKHKSLFVKSIFFTRFINLTKPR